jgi:hypothetical protein
VKVGAENVAADAIVSAAPRTVNVFMASLPIGPLLCAHHSVSQNATHFLGCDLAPHAAKQRCVPASP